MRTSPPIAPSDLEHATYLVLDDFGRIGRAKEKARFRKTPAPAHRSGLSKGEIRSLR